MVYINVYTLGNFFSCTFLHKIASIEVNKFGGFIDFSYLCRRKGEWGWRGHYALYNY